MMSVIYDGMSGIWKRKQGMSDICRIDKHYSSDVCEYYMECLLARTACASCLPSKEKSYKVSNICDICRLLVVSGIYEKCCEGGLLFVEQITWGV
jgi:hypothetical protein